jgi:hypothetical protein
MTADKLGRRQRCALADAIERSLAVMGEGRQRIETEHRAGSLERMQPSKDGVDEALIGEILTQIQQAAARPVRGGLPASSRNAAAGSSAVAHLPITLRAMRVSCSAFERS